MSLVSLALIGAGVQAATHLWGMSEVRPLKSVAVYDILPQAAESFIAAQSQRFPALDLPHHAEADQVGHEDLGAVLPHGLSIEAYLLARARQGGAISRMSYCNRYGRRSP